MAATPLQVLLRSTRTGLTIGSSTLYFCIDYFGSLRREIGSTLRVPCWEVVRSLFCVVAGELKNSAKNFGDANCSGMGFGISVGGWIHGLHINCYTRVSTLNKHIQHLKLLIHSFISIYLHSIALSTNPHYKGIHHPTNNPPQNNRKKQRNDHHHYIP